MEVAAAQPPAFSLAFEQRVRLLATHANMKATLALFASFSKLASTILEVVTPANAQACLTALMPEPRFLQRCWNALAVPFLAIRGIRVLSEPLLVFAPTFPTARRIGQRLEVGQDGR